MPQPGLYTFSKTQVHGQRAARSMSADQNGVNATTLQTQARGPEAGYVIYVYNIWSEPHVVEQPPLFSHFRIPGCGKGEKFAYTTLPAFVNERHEKPGTTDFYYNTVDGRTCATSLLNPDTYPGISWEAQLIDGEQLQKLGAANGDQTGNNLNAYGVFWSLTSPDDPKLLDEIKQFRKRLDNTMRGLITQGNTLNAAGDLRSITPLMHKAMDYFNLQAPWHMSSQHKIPCPNCGDPIIEGLAYHRNSFGDKCIIDHERYEASVEKEHAAAPPVANDAMDSKKVSRKKKGESEKI